MLRHHLNSYVLRGRAINKIVFVQKRTMLKNSINHILDSKILERYYRLKLPANKIFLTYIWIDGSNIHMRCKDRVMLKEVKTVKDCPQWAFDGSSTQLAGSASKSDTNLIPCVLYPDPFRMLPHVMVLCETRFFDGQPTATNHRSYCVDWMEKFKDEDPWFGIEQEYTFLDVDNWGLGWPKGGGFPAKNYKYSYCGTGAKFVAGRDISEAHARACVYSGLDFEGTNCEVMKGAWEYQIGTSKGMKGPDDAWMARYLMARVSEEFGVVSTFHPKPMGPEHDGIGCHHNFSTKTMRAKGGVKLIKEAMKSLEKNHAKHIDKYGKGPGSLTNRLRLTGKHETASWKKFAWGVGNRSASIRLQPTVIKNGYGFLEDRRPAGDCDPYLVCGLLLETILGGGGGDEKCPCKCPGK